MKLININCWNQNVRRKFLKRFKKCTQNIIRTDLKLASKGDKTMYKKLWRDERMKGCRRGWSKQGNEERKEGRRKISASFPTATPLLHPHAPLILIDSHQPPNTHCWLTCTLNINPTGLWVFVEGVCSSLVCMCVCVSVCESLGERIVSNLAAGLVLWSTSSLQTHTDRF